MILMQELRKRVSGGAGNKRVAFLLRLLLERRCSHLERITRRAGVLLQLAGSRAQFRDTFRPRIPVQADHLAFGQPDDQEEHHADDQVQSKRWQVARAPARKEFARQEAWP
jgi:hypothetical protein